jgi:hypothetical protein
LELEGFNSDVAEDSIFCAVSKGTYRYLEGSQFLRLQEHSVQGMQMSLLRIKAFMSATAFDLLPWQIHADNTYEQ